MKKKPGKPIVLISAVNFSEGGPLSILHDAVNAFIAHYISGYKLALLIHNKDLFANLENNPGIEIYEYRYPKKSWLLRIWFEYVHCWFISKKIRPCLWFSLHDVTPNVVTENKVVYCHNPAPFYNLSWRERKIERTLIFFNFFYSIFYRINIRKNKYVIVQQQWLRDEFINRYKVKKVIVAYPEVHLPAIGTTQTKTGGKYRFFFPAFPRVFKNFEVLLNAAAHLQVLNNNFEVLITIDGTENKYAGQLLKKFKHLSCIKFIGLQKREIIWKLYNECDCLVFPSKLETWGLPISEMKLYHKPMLVANCRYAYETTGNYDKVCFFDPGDSMQLSALMHQAINHTLEFNDIVLTQPQAPFAANWKDLYALILPDLKITHV